MEYTDATEQAKSTNSSLLGFLTILGILLFFVVVFKEASSSYALEKTHNDETVSVNR